MTPAGFPHSDIHGSKLESSSPWLFAGFRVLHRLLVPRHPPCALCSLTKTAPRGAVCRKPPSMPDASRQSSQMSRVRGSFRHHEPIFCPCLSSAWTDGNVLLYFRFGRFELIPKWPPPSASESAIADRPSGPFSHPPPGRDSASASPFPFGWSPFARRTTLVSSGGLVPLF
jgi:hypothetical protein